MSENNSLDEQGQHGPTSPHISEGNTREDDTQQRSSLLGVPLTGNILFTISWILGLGIPKAIYSYRGQSLISPTLDWVGGIIFTLIEFFELMSVRSLWLGVIESKRPELWPGFFEVDLAPCILKFLRRDDVLFWFTSVLPLLLVAESMTSSVVYIMWKHSTNVVLFEYSTGPFPTKVTTELTTVVMPAWPEKVTTLVVTSAWAEKVGTTWVFKTIVAQFVSGVSHDPLDPRVPLTLTTRFYNDGYVLQVLVASMALFLFCIHGLRVLWPKRLQGNVHYAFFVFAVMWWANLVFLCIKSVITNLHHPKFAPLMITMTIRLYVWMIPWAVLPILERHHFEGFFSRHSCSQQQFIQYLNAIWGMLTVSLEMTIMFAWQEHKFPETLYSSFFLCCALVPIWKGCSVIIPPSRVMAAPVAWFTSAWETRRS